MIFKFGISKLPGIDFQVNAVKLQGCRFARFLEKVEKKRSQSGIYYLNEMSNFEGGTRTNLGKKLPKETIAFQRFVFLGSLKKIPELKDLQVNLP